MRPTPMMPSVRPFIRCIFQLPIDGHPPSSPAMPACSHGMMRAVESRSAIACSATSSVPYAGAFATAMPSSVAAFTGIWSYPTPQRTTRRQFGSASMTRRLIQGSHATQKISASPACAMTSSSLRQFATISSPPAEAMAARSDSSGSSSCPRSTWKTLTDMCAPPGAWKPGSGDRRRPPG